MKTLKNFVMNSPCECADTIEKVFLKDIFDLDFDEKSIRMEAKLEYAYSDYNCDCACHACY